MIETKKEISNCNDINELNRLKSKAIQIDNEVHDGIENIPTYERKRIFETVQLLMRFVDIRNNLINSKRFAFKGLPILPDGTVDNSYVPGEHDVIFRDNEVEDENDVDKIDVDLNKGPQSREVKSLSSQELVESNIQSRETETEPIEEELEEEVCLQSIDIGSELKDTSAQKNNDHIPNSQSDVEITKDSESSSITNGNTSHEFENTPKRSTDQNEQTALVTKDPTLTKDSTSTEHNPRGSVSTNFTPENDLTLRKYSSTLIDSSPPIDSSLTTQVTSTENSTSTKESKPSTTTLESDVNNKAYFDKEEVTLKTTELKPSSKVANKLQSKLLSFEQQIEQEKESSINQRVQQSKSNNGNGQLLTVQMMVQKLAQNLETDKERAREKQSVKEKQFLKDTGYGSNKNKDDVKIDFSKNKVVDGSHSASNKDEVTKDTLKETIKSDESTPDTPTHSELRNNSPKESSHDTNKETNNNLNSLFTSLTKSKRTIDSTNLTHEHILFSNLESSIVVSDQKVEPYSVHIKQGLDSVIALKSKGPIFIHDLKHCVLILKCHQLRLHNIHDSLILVEVGNDRIVIEDCDNLKIGNYPTKSFESGIGKLEVDDFNCPIKLEKNKHFDYLSKTKYEKYKVKKYLGWINDIAEGEISDEDIYKFLPF